MKPSNYDIRQSLEKKVVQKVRWFVKGNVTDQGDETHVLFTAIRINIVYVKWIFIRILESLSGVLDKVVDHNSR